METGAGAKARSMVELQALKAPLFHGVAAPVWESSYPLVSG
jgi:hypothetical protein